MNLVQLNPPSLDPKTAPSFPAAAKIDLRDTQLRRNVARATDGAAPNNPAKLLGFRASPRTAKNDTTAPPTMKR